VYRVIGQALAFVCPEMSDIVRTNVMFVSHDWFSLVYRVIGRALVFVCPEVSDTVRANVKPAPARSRARGSDCSPGERGSCHGAATGWRAVRGGSGGRWGQRTSSGWWMIDRGQSRQGLSVGCRPADVGDETFIHQTAERER